MSWEKRLGSYRELGSDNSKEIGCSWEIHITFNDILKWNYPYFKQLKYVWLFLYCWPITIFFLLIIYFRLFPSPQPCSKRGWRWGASIPETFKNIFLWRNELISKKLLGMYLMPTAWLKKRTEVIPTCNSSVQFFK